MRRESFTVGRSRYGTDPFSPETLDSGGANGKSGRVKVILFGATGMVGQGVLRECLQDPGVRQVLSIVRRESGVRHDRLREIVHGDFLDFSRVSAELSGYDACFFCLGVSALGMSEGDYRRITFDVTIAAARAILERSPGAAFLYVSGTGTDGTARGKAMWARVKGETENALLALPFRAAYMLRPAYIQPLHGVRSSNGWTRLLYAAGAPLYPVWKGLFPKWVTTTEELGRAMIRLARDGDPRRVLESADLGELGREAVGK